MIRIPLLRTLLIEENIQKVKYRIIRSKSQNKVIQEDFLNLLSQLLKPVNLQRFHQMVRSQRWMIVLDILVNLQLKKRVLVEKVVPNTSSPISSPNFRLQQREESLLTIHTR